MCESRRVIFLDSTAHIAAQIDSLQVMVGNEGRNIFTEMPLIQQPSVEKTNNNKIYYLLLGD